MPLELLPFNTNRMRVGDRFGMLTVRSIGKTAKGAHFTICDCDCGTVDHAVQMARLVNGTTKSCGCQRGAHLITHGFGRTPLYSRWFHMMARCYKPRHVSFKNYGGRGIRVCDRWHDPVNFIADMAEGFSPELQLDRINNDGNYEPGNCRWTTTAENIDNRRSTRLVTYDGRTQSLHQWSIELGIPRKLLAKRIDERGWPVERAFTTPVLEKSEIGKIANAASQVVKYGKTIP